MFFQRIFTSGLAINSYLLGDASSKRCVVIDPVRRVTPFIIQAQNAGLDITDILETHVHADYVSGSKELKHQLNGKPNVYASGMGGKQWIPTYADIVVQQGTKIQLGKIRLEAIHAPGHTPEHIIWICYDESRSWTTPWFVFTGDCLFVDSIGRPDLLGGEETATLSSHLYHTLFEVLKPLPDFLEILPSHGQGSLCGKSLNAKANSTLGFERLFNPYLKETSKEQWMENLQKGLLPTPSYFERLKKLNIEGPPLLRVLKSEAWDQDKVALKDLFLLDVRHPESFAASYIQGSLNIPVSPSFCHWLGWMLPSSMPIGLIIEATCTYSEIIDYLRLMGFDQEIWIIQFEKYLQYPCASLSCFPMLDVEELAKHNLNFDPVYILDVRSQEEWQKGHILGSHHLELTRLASSLNQLPRGRSIALLCQSGQRASLAASLLQKYGFKSVMNIRGGVRAWEQAGLPLSSS